MTQTEEAVNRREEAVRPDAAGPSPESLPLPPGRRGPPIVGETLEFVRSPADFVQRRREAHGNVFRTNVLGRDTVFLLGPEANAWIFAHDRKDLVNRWPYGIRRLLGPTSVSMLEGTAHRARRKLLAPHFSRTAAARFTPTLHALAERHFGAWAKRDGALEVYEAMRAFTFEAACTVILGGVEDLDVHALHERFEAFTEGMFSLAPLDVPGLPFHRSLAAKAWLEEHLAELVLRRRERSAQPKDVLGALIGARDEDGRSLSVEQIVDELVLQLWAGHDTTVNVLSNLVMQLALHPEVLRRGREEQDAHRDAPLTGQAFEAMPYLNRIIHEGMRAIPPVAGSFRVTKRTMAFGGYRIPKGWTVALSIAGSARDPRWTEADRFDPDRWAEPRAEHAQHAQMAVPFGGGPRQCLGKFFALAEMRVALAVLLRGFSWTLLPDQDLRLEPLPFPRPKSGIRVWFERRS